MLVFDNTIHKVTVGAGEISDAGQSEISQYIYSKYYTSLPDWWEWCAVVSRGAYAGSFVKRLSKYFFKNGLKLSTDDASHIGSLVGKHSEQQSDFFLRFTEDDWEAGDFGDDGSCYWGERSVGRYVLRKCGMKAVQFFKDISGKEGFARALLIKPQQDWILFNGYGMDTIKIARIASQHLGCSYRQVYLHNCGEVCGTIYINNSGKAAYALAQNVSCYAEPPELSKIDCQIKLSDYLNQCNHCRLYRADEEMDEGYCHDCIDCTEQCDSCTNRQEELNTTSDGAVCDSCFECYALCESCDVYHKNIEEYNGIGFLCEDCLDKYIECPHCNQYIRKED